MRDSRIDIIKSQGSVCGGETLTVGSASAVAMSPPAGALYALASIEIDNSSSDTFKALRFYVAEEPTSTTGHILPDGAFIEFFGSNMRAAKFISTEATKSHKVVITYYC